MEKKINLIVKEDDKNLRIDVLINKKEKDISRTRITNLILDQRLKLNNKISEEPHRLKLSPYHNNWFFILDYDHLDEELKELKIGKSAVDFYQTELDKLKTLHKNLRAGNEKQGYKPEKFVGIGEMSNLDSNSWDKYITEFFN